MLFYALSYVSREVIGGASTTRDQPCATMAANSMGTSTLGGEGEFRRRDGAPQRGPESADTHTSSRHARLDDDDEVEVRVCRAA